MSVPIGAGKPRQGSLQRKRYGAERHAQYLGDLAVAEALRPQVQATAVLFRQGAHHSLQARMSLALNRLLLGTGARVKLAGGIVGARQNRVTTPARAAPFQRQIVAHAKDPTRQVRPRLALPQMLKQRQKSVLDDFIRVRSG